MRMAQVHGVCETVQSHRNPDLAFLQSPPCYSTVKTPDGTTLTEDSEIRDRWAGFFEELYHVDPHREFPEDVDVVRDAEPPVSCDPLILEKTGRALNQLKSGKAPGGCGIYALDVQGGGAAALLWLHIQLISILDTRIIPTD